MRTARKRSRKKRTRNRNESIRAPVNIPLDLSSEQQHVESKSTKETLKNVKTLVRCIELGNPTMTTLALMCLCEHDLMVPQLRPILMSLIPIILNLLTTEQTRVSIASLRCLKVLLNQETVRCSLSSYGAIKRIVQLLKHPDSEVQLQVVKTVATLYSSILAMDSNQQRKVIQNLLKIVELSQSHIIYSAAENLTFEKKQCLKLAVAATETLALVASTKLNRTIWNPINSETFLKILTCEHVELVRATINLINVSARKHFICNRIVMNRSILSIIKKHMLESQQCLTKDCAALLMKCTQSNAACIALKERGFISLLCSISRDEETYNNSELLFYLTGAMKQFAKCISCVKIIVELNGINILIGFLKTHSQTAIVVHSIACLEQCFHYEPSIEIFLRSNGFPIFTELLQKTCEPLIMEQLDRAMAQLSTHNAFLKPMLDTNSLGLIWSHLENRSLGVATAAAWSLSKIIPKLTCLSYKQPLVQSAETLKQNLQFGNIKMKTSSLALIAQLCQHVENAAVLADWGIPKVLSDLIKRKLRGERPMYFLCKAISSCCKHDASRMYFSNERITYPLIYILERSKTEKLKGAACTALHHMSTISQWCQVLLTRKKSLLNLLDLSQSNTEHVRISAAQILQNIRKNAMNN